jgi:hypothetical protein
MQPTQTSGYPCSEDDAEAHFDAIGDTGDGYYSLGRLYEVECIWCGMQFAARTKRDAVALYRIHEDTLRTQLAAESGR